MNVLAQPESDPVVIRAGGEEVALSQFNTRFDTAMRLLAMRQGNPPGDDVPGRFEKLRSAYLLHRATELALLQEAVRRGISVTAEEVEAELDALVPATGEEGDTEKALEQAGLEDEELVREFLSEARKVRKLLERLQEELVVPESRVAGLYEDIKFHLTEPEKVCVRQIVVGSEDQANEIRQQLEDGKEFELLAEQRSVDEASAARGGEVGCLEKADMARKLGLSRFDVRKGELAGPLRSERGYHLVLVYDRIHERVPALNEVHDLLVQELRQDVLRERIESLKNEASVEVFPERLQDSAPAKERR